MWIQTSVAYSDSKQQKIYRCDQKDQETTEDVAPHLPLAVSLAFFLNGCRFTNSNSSHLFFYQSLLLTPSPNLPSILVKRKREGDKWTEGEEGAEKSVCTCVFICLTVREKPLTSLCLSNPACFPKPAQEVKSVTSTFPAHHSVLQLIQYHASVVVG